jgi:Apea-like HEPN
MHSANTAVVVHKIKKIAANTHPFNPRQDNPFSSLLITGASNWYVVEKDFHAEYRTLVKEILDEHGDRFSRKQVMEDADSIIAQFIEDGDEESLEANVQELITSYETFGDEQQVYVPIAGLNLYVDSLKFGNAEFLKTAEAIKRIKDERKRLVLDESGDDKAAEVLRMVEEQWKTNTCALLTVRAEPERAKELAVEECKRLLDVLIFSAASIYHSDWRVSRGVRVQMTEVSSSTSTAVIAPTGRILAGFRTSGPVSIFDINDRNIESMRSVQAFKIAELMTKPDATEIEKQTVRAVHWFAESQVQEDEGNEVLGLITCLEMFLSPEAGEPIRLAVAEGTAMLLEDDLAERKKIKRFINRMYKKRNKVTHGGKPEPDTGELRMLRTMVIGLIVRMTENPDAWSSLNDIRCYLEDQRLS